MKSINYHFKIIFSAFLKTNADKYTLFVILGGLTELEETGHRREFGFEALPWRK